MVIIYFIEEGLVKRTYPIKNPGVISIKRLIRAFEKSIRKGKSFSLEFDNVSPRVREIWNTAKKFAELKVLCEDLKKCNLALSKTFFYRGILQLPYFYPGSLAKNFVKTISARKYAVEILENGAMEIFDGEKVVTVPPSDKEEKDIIKDK